ncbi:hypothetical protein V5799_028680 [Amblyomma americanum]|uniref:Uncharacterized protein n=1 Tax=Amblyomma americanum TaxID=6943 RepID=A0AAQ4DC65_AMBAM
MTVSQPLTLFTGRLALVERQHDGHIHRHHSKSQLHFVYLFAALLELLAGQFKCVSSSSPEPEESSQQKESCCSASTESF